MLLIKKYKEYGLKVNHYLIGYTSDGFEILENKQELSHERIARILIDKHYGEKNSLDYKVKGNKIIIHEDYDWYFGAI